MKQHARRILAAVLAAVWLPVLSSQADETATAKRILDAAGVRGGLIITIGVTEAEQLVDMQRNDACLVQALLRDAENISSLRGVLARMGRYGAITIASWTGDRLPYPENTVNQLIVANAAGVSTGEIMRVLAPFGVARIEDGQRWKTIQKPWPDDIDGWPQWRYGPDNISVSKDRRAGAPRHVQWINGPLWGRHHESADTTPALVSANGRIFVVDDFGPAGIRTGDIPAKCILRGIDAFSGMVLWRRPVDWVVPNNRPGTPYGDRMLAADGDLVFVAPGGDKPIEALDGATGKTLKTFAGTEGAIEFIVTKGLLYVNVPVSASEIERADRPTGDRMYPTIEVCLAAVDRESGAMRWRHPAKKIMPETLAFRDGRVCHMLADESVAAFNADTGKQLWSASPAKSESSRLGWEPWALRDLAITDGVVLTHSTHGQTAFDATTGRVLWKTEVPKGFNLLASFDFFMHDGLLWMLPPNIWGLGHTRFPSTMPSSELQGVDPQTGKVVKRVDISIVQSEHHWRCYLNRATDRYIFGARRGIETIPFDGGEISLQPWTRGACRTGILPANGLVYATPHPCACAMPVKLNGFYAMAPENADFKAPTSDGVKAVAVETGPAMGNVPEPAGPADWSTYRGGIERAASTKAGLGTTLRPRWQTDVGQGITHPTAGYGLVFAGSGRECRMMAFDQKDGKPRWSVDLPGPVDTPPTLYKGLALFGCRDGSVYAVRASDGVLVWRRRIVPEERRIVVNGRIESAWPVHGGVLLWKDTAYVLAGRQSYLDGGMMLVTLDPLTGAMKDVAPVASDPALKKNTNDIPGTIADVLTVSAEVLYLNMRHAFGADLRVVEPARHLYAFGGMLDDSWHNRTGWTVSEKLSWANAVGSNVDGSRLAHNLVLDGNMLYGLKAFDSDKRQSRFLPGGTGYSLFSVPLAGEGARSKKKGNPGEVSGGWNRKVPVRATALAKASDKLVFAGAPDKVDATDPWASFEGRAGALLCIVSAADGKELAKLTIDSPPIFNGMAVTENRIWLTTMDGKLRAFAAE